jgi:hypothetical protein
MVSAEIVYRNGSGPSSVYSKVAAEGAAAVGSRLVAVQRGASAAVAVTLADATTNAFQ